MTEWLYGRHAVEEALRAGRRRISRVLLASALPGKPQRGESGNRFTLISNLAREKNIPVEQVQAQRLDALTRVGQHHQGVAAEVSAFSYGTLSDTVELCRAAGKAALVVVLDSIQDPQNFGTLLRTCEATHVTVILMLDRRQVEVTPAVVNASSGAVEHLHVCLTNNIPRAIETLQEAGLWVYALAAEPAATLYSQADLSGPVGLVVGSEGRGVGRLARERCDGALAIPMLGKVESLNAAVAGSIVLYETIRQREETH